MLAVSGSHIAYIITGFSFLLGKTNKRFTKIFTIIFLIFFMALTGFTSSVIRACIMGILVLIGGLIHRKPDTINNLGISSLIILIFNPYSIADVGFTLSFAGTIGIVLLNDKINNCIYRLICKITKNKFNLLDNNEKLLYKLIRGIINSFCITLSANLLIIPIMAYNFSTISFTFWISNILAGPIMEIATIYGFIVYIFSAIFSFLPAISSFLGFFLNILLSSLLKIAELSSIIPGSSMYIKTPYVFECVIYYFIIFILFNLNSIKEHILIKKVKKYFNKQKNLQKYLKKIYKHKLIIIALALLVILSTYCLIFFIPNDLRIYFVDVGQGDCTLIKTPEDKVVLIDGGGSEFGSFDVGESILLPYLLDRRILKIDYLFISHMDSDHVGGLFSIMENIEIKNIVISKQGKVSENLKKFYEIVNRKNIKVNTVSAGDVIKIDKYSYFEIIFPEDSLISENILNNNSIVTKFNSLNFSILFTGDIEEIAEDRIYEMYKNSNKLNSFVLKVAHHGSKTSTTKKFLDLVKPKIALIGVGEDNNFGHPNMGVIDRIKEFTNLIFRTDLCGEIEITFDGKNIKINTVNKTNIIN